MIRIAPLIAALAIASLPLPASAAEERILTIFGKDKCPENTICVRAPEGERYRIPKALRDPAKTPDAVSWTQRSQATLNEGKQNGAGNCSAVGASNWTGCWAEEMRKMRAQAKADAAAEEVPLP
jgi:hypothetical protein